ncbi:MAG: M20/M25/M40 family metallo-hydrolase [Verrucomicrobiales bacterium]
MKAAIAKISKDFEGSTTAYDRMAEICDRFGPRPAGSTNLELAIDWIIEKAKADGLRVATEPVSLQAWERGEESGELLLPRPHKLHLLGLGGSIPTPPEGITAEVLVVASLRELTNAAAAKGKIVLIDQPFTTYGETVAIRSRGAIEAAKLGSVACLIRSVAPYSMQTPHTGRMRYDPSVPRIPAAAISLEDSAMMARMQSRGDKLQVRLKMNSREFPATSRNVLAELPGREKPDEIVVVGGHIDSWDVGQGAMDDAGGCVAAWEALRVIHKLGLQPRRTIRLVLWTNEENGIDGANTYARLHDAELPKHIAALETDQGTFQPIGLNYTGPENTRSYLDQLLKLISPTGAAKILGPSGDTDLIPLREKKVPAFDLVTERSRYFWYHHSDADTVDKLDPRELSACAELIATLAFALAESEASLLPSGPR